MTRCPVTLHLDVMDAQCQGAAGHDGPHTFRALHQLGAVYGEAMERALRAGMDDVRRAVEDMAEAVAQQPPRSRWWRLRWTTWTRWHLLTCRRRDHRRDHEDYRYWLALQSGKTRPPKIVDN